MPDAPPAPLTEREYEIEYEVGQDNVEVLGLDVHNPVFFLAATLVLLFSGLTLVFPTLSASVLSAARAHTLQSFDWLFAATPVIVFVFCMALAFSPLGRIRLGGQSAVPDYKIHSWVAMLFAATAHHLKRTLGQRNKRQVCSQSSHP